MPACMKIRSAYSTLPNAERKVADFILKNQERAMHMVINEIASEVGVSVPSVTRLARKLGYNSFLDFRVALANSSKEADPKRGTPVSDQDSDSAVIEKTFFSAARALDDTNKALDKQAFMRFSIELCKSHRVFVMGQSTCALLAQDFAHELCKLGLDASAFTDSLQMGACRSQFSRGCTVIGLSRSGKEKCWSDIMKEASEHGAITAYVSNYLNAPAAQNCDYFFNTSRIEDLRTLVGRETYDSMLVLLDTLLLLVSRHKS